MTSTEQQEDDRTVALRRLLVTTVAESAGTATPNASRQGIFAVGGALVLAAIAAVLVIPALGGLFPQATIGPAAQPPGSTSGMRATLYSSVEELAADSGAIVTGTVVSQQPGADGSVVSDLEVTASYRPAELGANLRGGPVPIPEGAIVKVTTFGGVTSVGSTDVTSGKQYLMFLTPTDLPGATQDEFFITGVTAGLYSADGARFVKAPSEGDRLPEVLTVEELGQS